VLLSRNRSPLPDTHHAPADIESALRARYRRAADESRDVRRRLTFAAREWLVRSCATSTRGFIES